MPLVLAIDHENGWLIAGVLETGWLPKLNADQRHTLSAALAGLYKMAGVDMTREQIAECLPKTTFAFDVTDAGLTVWPAADGDEDVVYDLGAGTELPPTPLNGAMPTGMPVLDPGRLLLSKTPLRWSDWARICDGNQANGEHRTPVLLPGDGASVEA